ncbi:MAG: sigma-70 family RNA polymerase sigma factor [Vicinamibacteraceae bacterium]
MSATVYSVMEGSEAGKARAPAEKVAGEPRPAETSFELVRRACSGDSEAENEICRRYSPRLHKWARGRLPAGARPAMDTGDIVQDVLIRAIRSFPDFQLRHEHSFPAFLRTILANRLLDLGRVDARRPPPTPLEDGVDPPARDPSPFDAAAAAERQGRFDAALKRLSVSDQELIFLRTELGCDYEEITRMLGRSNPNALRVAVRRAILRLGEQIAKRDVV